MLKINYKTNANNSSQADLTLSVPATGAGCRQSGSEWRASWFWWWCCCCWEGRCWWTAVQCVPCWLRADCVCLPTPVQQSRSGEVCIHISHSTYLTLGIHLISPASTRLLDSTYPHHSCITVYTHTTHTHMYYTYFTVYTPPCNITLCTHMTPSSKCVPTQHPLHSVYPHNIQFTMCTHTTSNSKCVPP